MALLFNTLLCLSCVAMSFCSAPAPSSSCSALKTFFKDRGLQQSVVPSSPALGNVLKVCPKVNQTCCTLKVEQNFKGLAQKDFDGALTNNIDPTKLFFETQGKKFDDYFKKVVKKSEVDLNVMFTKTYGILYKQNSKIFMDLFAELNKYFAGKNLDLSKVMDKFFADLLRKMFQLLNPDMSFTTQYLQCVADLKDSLKPFGEVPQKLPNQIKKAFVEARVFVEGLNVGRDVLSDMAGITASESCQAGIAEMKYCSLCSGYDIVKPCKDYCQSIFKGCFLGWDYLNPHWDYYIRALTELTENLDSFEGVVDPIDVTISDAIMIMQDNSLDIKQKVFSQCGSAKGKTKRSVSNGDFFIDSPKKRNRRGIGKDASQSPQPTAAGASLERLVKAFKTKVKGTKGMWNTMPESVCTTVAASVKAECWNGTAKIIPAVGTVPNKSVLSNDISNDQIPGIIKRQISQLKLIVQKLKSARNGEDVIVEGDGDNYDGSGSGSGSGSGNEIPTDSSRTLSPTDGNSLDDNNMFGGGLETNALDGGNSAFSIRPSTWLVLSSICLLLRVIGI